MLTATGAPAPPTPRGPVSEVVVDALRGGPVRTVEPGDPYGDDLQLALHCCYELHYRGFAGVPADLEWDPALLTLRRELERTFLAALRAEVPAGDDVDAEVAALLVEPRGPHVRGVSHHLRRAGELWQLREYVTHRSIYHLKEADPQAWVIPRLTGAAKAGLVTVEHDEYGGGRPEHMHATLFAEMMRELALADTYGAYVDRVPGVTLAEVNLMTLCGLHRELRGASVGQFAMVELTSSPGSERLVRGMRRMGLGEAAVRFYDEHVEADAVHEAIAAHDLAEGLARTEPELMGDILFGGAALLELEGRFARAVLSAWDAGASSLLPPACG